MSKKQKLELTWIGKRKTSPKLEPHILLEDPLMSDHAKHRLTENDIFDNRLIFGDNLLALQDVGANSFALFMNQQRANKFTPTSGLSGYLGGVEFIPSE